MSTGPGTAPWWYSGWDNIEQLAVSGGRPWFDVLADGADPTGQRDSAPMIQYTLNKVPSSGGVVNIPPGTYLIGSVVTTKPSTVIQAHWATLMLLPGANLTGPFWQMNTSTMMLGGIFDGNYSNQTAGGNARGIVETVGSGNVRFQWTRVQNAWGCGIRFNETSGGFTTGIVDDCTFTSIGLSSTSASGSGVAAFSASPNICSDLRILNSTFSGCGMPGATNAQVIGLGVGTDNVKVLGNTISNYPCMGIALGTGGTDALVAHNHVDGSSASIDGCIDTGTWVNLTVDDNELIGAGSSGTGGGIANGPPNGTMIVTGNRVRNSGAYGISIGTGGEGLLIVQGNLVVGSSADGLCASNTTGGSITGNICQNNGQNYSGSVATVHRNGIEIYGDSTGTSSDLIVTGNTCIDQQATATQQYGVYLYNNGGTDFANVGVVYNVFDGNVKGGVGNSGTLGSGCVTTPNIGQT